MKTIQIGFIAGFAFLLVSLTARAQGDLIGAESFMAFYKSDNSLLVVDASNAESYSKKHIRGAVNIPYKALNREDGVKGLVKEMDELAALFAAKGIDSATTIVVYDDGSMKYASRVYWILKYAGADKVKLLRKDPKEWKKAKLPLTKKVSAPASGAFIPQVNLSVFAGLAEVENRDAKLLDARSAAEFDGSSAYSRGHLPGAVNIDYRDVLDKNGTFKTKKEIEDIFKGNGLDKNSPVIVYCRSGVRATVLFVAAVNILGWENVKVYDGSYLEWVAKGNKVSK